MELPGTLEVFLFICPRSSLVGYRASHYPTILSYQTGKTKRENKLELSWTNFTLSWYLIQRLRCPTFYKTVLIGGLILID